VGPDLCPAKLSFQWQRELKEKFGESFLVPRGTDIREQFGMTKWLERNQVITSLDLAKRDDILPGLRLIEVKGLGEAPGTVLLTPNEKRVAEDRRDCYWLYVVANCHREPQLEAIEDPARLPWHEVVKGTTTTWT